MPLSGYFRRTHKACFHALSQDILHENIVVNAQVQERLLNRDHYAIIKNVTITKSEQRNFSSEKNSAIAWRIDEKKH